MILWCAVQQAHSRTSQNGDHLYINENGTQVYPITLSQTDNNYYIGRFKLRTHDNQPYIIGNQSAYILHTNRWKRLLGFIGTNPVVDEP